MIPNNPEDERVHLRFTQQLTVFRCTRYFVTGWRRIWREWLGWLPVQFCMVCGRAYWGGWPSWTWSEGRPRQQWMPWWKDCCSAACAAEDESCTWS